MPIARSLAAYHQSTHLGDEEWRTILRRADALMPHHRYESVPYDFIAEYARSKVGTSIVSAHESGGTIEVELDGESVVPLRLYLFAGEDGDEHRFELTDAFRGRATMRFSAGPPTGSGRAR
jgi:hypothetical protein